MPSIFYLIYRFLGYISPSKIILRYTSLNIIRIDNYYKKEAAKKTRLLCYWMNNPLNNDLKAKVVFGVPECAAKTKWAVLAV